MDLVDDAGNGRVRACLESPMRVDWGGKWMDARTQIRSIFRNMLRIEDAADGRLPPQGTPGGVSKQALKKPGIRAMNALRNLSQALLHRFRFGAERRHIPALQYHGQICRVAIGRFGAVRVDGHGRLSRLFPAGFIKPAAHGQQRQG